MNLLNHPYNTLVCVMYRACELYSMQVNLKIVKMSSRSSTSVTQQLMGIQFTGKGRNWSEIKTPAMSAVYTQGPRQSSCFTLSIHYCSIAPIANADTIFFCCILQHADMFFPGNDTSREACSKSGSTFNRNTCLKQNIKQGRMVLTHTVRKIKMEKSATDNTLCYLASVNAI